MKLDYPFKLLVLYLLLSFSINVNAIKISEIEILGLNTVSRGTILNYLPLEMGDEINNKLLNDSYNSLKNTNLFRKINFRVEETKIIIEIEENPTIKFVDFSGFSEDEVLSEKIVSEIKQNFKLSQGDIFVKENLDNVISQIQKLYQMNAFYQATIKISPKIDDLNRIGIEIKIDEGEKALIEKFQISGSTVFDYDELIDLFNMGEPDFFLLNYFTKNDSFSKLEFDAGIEKLKTKFTSQGFLDFSIVNSDITYNEKTNKLSISIVINEGPEYKIGSINFKGNFLELSEIKLRSFFSISKGDTFKRSQIINEITSLQEHYQNLGYAYTKIDSNITKKDNFFLDIDIEIQPDLLIYISRIEIAGNNRTQDDVIRRKININEGQRYSLKDINESINRIKRSGFFSEVNYQIRRRVSESDKADIFIQVQETKTGEISIGLSHSNSTGAALNAGIKQNNIFGTGNTLNANFSNSSAVKDTSFYFKDPHFNNLGHAISYGLFNKSIDASNLDASSYTIDEAGFVVGYGVPVSESSELFGEFRASSIDLKCGSNLKNIFEIEECSSSDDLDTNIVFSYSKNTLNDSFFPTNGNSTNIQTTLSTPFTDFKYYKLETSYRSYSPILGDKTLKSSSRLKFASGYGGDDLPFYKRYYEGGSSSVRGFDFNSLGPKYSDDKPKGGEVSLISSLGLASGVDIIGIDNDNMRIIGFIDAGTLAPKLSSFKLEDIRSSIGVQLSWLTPIGPIGINFAQPIVKKSNDKITNFEFELGAKF